MGVTLVADTINSNKAVAAGGAVTRSGNIIQSASSFYHHFTTIIIIIMIIIIMTINQLTCTPPLSPTSCPTRRRWWRLSWRRFLTPPGPPRNVRSQSLRLRLRRTFPPSVGPGGHWTSHCWPLPSSPVAE